MCFLNLKNIVTMYLANYLKTMSRYISGIPELSSVGRAKDCSSLGHWFEPGSSEILNIIIHNYYI